MKLELTKQQAESLVSLAAFADNPRTTYTPVLTEIRVTVKDNQLEAVATDRFCVARFIDEAIAPDLELRLTAGLVAWIKTNLKTMGSSLGLSIGEGGAVTAYASSSSFTDTPTASKFPGVETLFAEWEAAATIPALSLRAEFLGKLEKLKADGKKAELWRFEPGANKNGGSRPGPLKATALKVNGKLTALIAPNLLVD